MAKEKKGDVAVFESTPKGWEFSRPVSEELRRRGMTVVEARPQSGATVYHGVSKALNFGIVSVPFGHISRGEIGRVVRELLHTHPRELIRNDQQVDVAAAVISRRLSDYMPGIASSAALARLSVQELGARATLQEGHTSPSARAFILEAEHLGAHTFAAHHGLVDSSAPEREYMASPGTIFEWGRLQAAFPSNSSRVCVVGSHLVEARIGDLVNRRRRIEKDTVVLVAFGRPGRIVDPEFFASSIRMVGAASAVNNACPFVVNMHPGDSEAFWEVALSTIEGPHRLVFSRDRVYELMERAVAVVTNHSTVGAEAMLADIPVICITAHHDQESSEVRKATYVPSYLSEGAAYAVTSVDEINATVSALLDSDTDRSAEARREYARRFLDKSSELSSLARTADVIEEVVRS